MIPALTVLHIVVCLILIAVVLLQRGKGAEIGAVFGGGASSTVFGSRGAGTFLSKLTTGCAVLFMTTSLSLSYLHSRSGGERLFEGGAVEESDVTETPFEQLGTVMPDESTDANAEEAAAATDSGAADAGAADQRDDAPVELP